MNLQRIADKYARITNENIDSLKRKSVALITYVLTEHRKRNTLHKILPEAFPAVNDHWQAPSASYSGDFSRELQWGVARLRQYSSELNEYLKLRASFGANLVLGELELAKKTLDNCQQRFGVSLWMIESELLLSEYTGGFEKNRETLSKILEGQYHQNVKLLAEFASQRVECTLSLPHYSRNLQAFLDRTDYSSVHVSLPTYLKFLLSPEVLQNTLLDQAACAYCVHLDSARSLIDQYLGLLRLFRHILYYRSESLLSKVDIDSIAWMSKLGQFELTNLLHLGFGIPPRNDESTYLHALSDYLTGNFATAAAKATESIIHSPLCYDWYVLLAKASIMAGEMLPQCLPVNSTSQKILENTYEHLKYGPASSQAFGYLAKAAIALDSTPLGYQISGFCFNAHPNRKVDTTWSNAVASVYANPIDAAFLPKKQRALMIKHIRSQHIPGVVLKCAEAANASANALSFSEADFGIADQEARLLLGRIYLSKKQLDPALLFFKQVLSSQRGRSPVVAEALQGACACLFALKDYDQAAETLLSTELEPTSLLHLVDIGPLIERYRMCDSGASHSSPAWPILHFLHFLLGGSETTREDVFEAYANYMSAQQVARPSQIVLPSQLATKNQLVFFLRWICDPSIIDSDIEFAGTDDVEAERVAVCQLLQKIDPENSAEYANEISRLEQNRAVRKALQYVAESKIYFNIEGVETSLDKSFHERYERYKAMSNLAANARRGIEVRWHNEHGRFVVNADASLLLFIELFEEVKHAYLFSDEHGLDSYLSVRIRHQTIKGALRSVFERANLVTEKDKNGEYAENHAWEKHLNGFDKDTQQSLQKALGDFSELVDGIISDVSQRRMRIKGAVGGEDGLFEMNFTQIELAQLHEALHGVESVYEFLDEVFGCLTKRLEMCLATIRNWIQADLMQRFEHVLNSLTIRLDSISSQVPSTVSTAIIRTKTEIQYMLDEISTWFQLQGSTQLEDFPLETLLAAATANIAQCFPSSPFECETNCPQWLRLKGECFRPLWDIFFSVFENVVRYSRENAAETTLEVGVSESLIHIRIANLLGPDQDAGIVTARLNSIRKSAPEVVRREGGTGYVKLRKLLRNDLSRRQDNVCFEAIESRFVTSISFELDGIVA